MEFTAEHQERLIEFLKGTEAGQAVSFRPNDLRALLLEYGRLKVSDAEKTVACQAALWELQGHLEKGTAAPILKQALGCESAKQGA